MPTPDNDFRRQDDAFLSRLETSIEFQNRQLGQIVDELKELRKEFTKKHEGNLEAVQELALAQASLETTIRTSKTWLSILLSFLIGVGGMLSWTVTKLLDNLWEMHSWQAATEIRLSTLERGTNYGNEGRSYTAPPKH